jgi:hypothetical protein
MRRRKEKRRRKKKKKKRRREKRNEKKKKKKQTVKPWEPWEALGVQNIHCYSQSISFLKIPQINFSKGLVLQDPIVRLPSHINRFVHHLTLKDN